MASSPNPFQRIPPISGLGQTNPALPLSLSLSLLRWIFLSNFIEEIDRKLGFFLLYIVVKIVFSREKRYSIWSSLHCIFGLGLRSALRKPKHWFSFFWIPFEWLWFISSWAFIFINGGFWVFVFLMGNSVFHICCSRFFRYFVGLRLWFEWWGLLVFWGTLRCACLCLFFLLLILGLMGSCNGFCVSVWIIGFWCFGGFHFS